MTARTLHDHQATAIQMLRSSLGKGKRRPILQASTGFGKCLGIGTPVMKHNGSVVLVESVQAGDRLMGPDGQPRTVLGVTRGTGPLFRIVPVRGTPWVCNDVHVLTLVHTVTGDVIDIPLNEYARQTKTFRHVHKQFAPEHGVDFDPQEALRVDPYFLGVWLGDGTKSLVGVQVSKPDPEIRAACEDVAATWGCTVRTSSTTGGRCPTYCLVTPRGKANPLLQVMRSIFGPDGDFRPIQTASRAERQQFLAGIIDTDGYAKNGCVEIAQKRSDHADLIAFVARSLGFRVSMTTKLVNGDTYTRMGLNGDFVEIPTRIMRKHLNPRRQKKVATRTGFTVEPIGIGAYAGFELDGDGRFLLGDFTVTHNTVVSGAIINSALGKGKRVAFVVPAISLVDQTVSSFWDDGIRDVGVIQADHFRTDWSRPVQVCSIQTVKARGYPEADLVLVDECHKIFKCQVDWMADPAWQKVPFIGLSATPWSPGLGKIYDDLLIASTTQDLIDKGFLSKFRVFAPSHPDLTGVRTQRGDFVEADLAKAVNKRHIVADVVETWMRLGENRPTLVFAVDRAHAKSLQQRYEEVGIPCGYIDAYTSDDERRIVARKFKSGEYPVVASVGTLTTGVDWDVRCIVLARPTKSEILFTQIIGRGLRTAPGKDDCIILDHSDNHTRLGFVTDIRHETLSMGARPSSQQRSSEAMPKECTQCAFLRPAKVLQCPACGFKPKPVSQVQTFDGKLDEVVRGKGTKSTGPANTVRMGGKWIPLGEFYGMLRQRATDKGYSDGWTSNQYRDAVGTWPNAYKLVPMIPVSPEVNSWLISRAIAYAKRRDKTKGGGDARVPL